MEGECVSFVKKSMKEERKDHKLMCTSEPSAGPSYIQGRLGAREAAIDKSA